LKSERQEEKIGAYLGDSEHVSALNGFFTNRGRFPEILPAIIHKLKNKLTPILGYSQILKMKNKDDSIKEKIDKIEKNALELTSLFEDFKNSIVTRKSVFELLNLNDLIILEKNLFLKIKEAGIKLILNIDNSIPSLYLNHEDISLLLRNAVQNAITSILLKKSKDGEITISTGKNYDGVYLSVKDNGVGIDSVDIDNIWVPFFSKFPNRSGIGLLTSEKIITNHNGKYSVESIQGKSAEFIFTFPSDDSKENGVDALFVGFDKREITIIDELLDKSDSVRLHGVIIEDINKTGISEIDYDFIFVNSEIVNREETYREVLRSLSEKFKGSEILLFRSGNNSSYILNLIAEGDITVMPDKTKLLTITNVLSKVIKRRNNGS